MILVDSSVWIDHFRDSDTPQTAKLRPVLANAPESIILADLVFLEVLRGVTTDKMRRTIEGAFEVLEVTDIAGHAACRSAVAKYTLLRQKGLTVAKTVDLLIASWCIDEGVTLLHDDKDFLPFVKLGLKVA